MSCLGHRFLIAWDRVFCPGLSSVLGMWHAFSLKTQSKPDSLVLLSPFISESWSWQTLTDLPKVMGLHKGRAGLEYKSIWLHSLCLVQSRTPGSINESQHKVTVSQSTCGFLGKHTHWSLMYSSVTFRLFTPVQRLPGSRYNTLLRPKQTATGPSQSTPRWLLASTICFQYSCPGSGVKTLTIEIIRYSLCELGQIT
jgi:hypothetical protein